MLKIICCLKLKFLNFKQKLIDFKLVKFWMKCFSMIPSLKVKWYILFYKEKFFFLCFQLTKCSELLNAKCVADYCNGCMARFYDMLNGNEITDQCGVKGVCNMMCVAGSQCMLTPMGARCVPSQCADNTCSSCETCVPQSCITEPCPQYQCVRKLDCYS